jgi:hypothetical protein
MDNTIAILDKESKQARVETKEELTVGLPCWRSRPSYPQSDGRDTLDEPRRLYRPFTGVIASSGGIHSIILQLERM